MGSFKATRIVAIIVILVAWSVILFATCGFGPHFDAKPHEALGQVAAEEALKLLGSGGKLTVITRDTSIFKMPALDAQLRSFRSTIKKAGQNVAATKLIEVDPLRLVAMPSGDFTVLIGKQSEADVIVSFAGPPLLSAEQLAQLGASRPKVVAVCSGAMPVQINLKAVFEKQLLHAAIISRNNPAPGRPSSREARSTFEQFFSVVTPANLAELPVPDLK